MASQTISYMITIPLVVALVYMLFMNPLSRLFVTSVSIESGLSDYTSHQIESYLDVTIIGVVGNSVSINVTNDGAETVWLNSIKGYGKTTVVVAYMGQTGWVSYELPFTIVEVGVVNTGQLYDPNTHVWISPGEYAILDVRLPQPPLPNNSLQVCVFTEDGVSGSDETYL